MNKDDCDHRIKNKYNMIWLKRTEQTMRRVKMRFIT